MSIKKWDIPWNASAALIDFARLDAEEIAVTIQIINLIYAQNGPIPNSPEDIKGYVKKMSRARCEKVIHNLIHKGVLQVVNENLSHKKCEEILKNRELSHNKFSLFGKLGAETRDRNKQNQGDLLSPPKQRLQPDLSSSSSLLESKPLSILSSVARRGFSIFDRLTEDGERRARDAAPGWDLRRLAAKFDEKIQDGSFKAPVDPDSAFAAWAGKYTKGKKP